MPVGLNLNIEQMDDPMVGDGTPSFMGGMVSNDQSNLIAETESSFLLNCDRNRIGKVVTRRGLAILGSSIGSGYIQGLSYFWTKDYNYPVAACDGKIFKFESGIWTRIGMGGVFDQDTIEIVKQGAVNQPGSPGPPIVPPSYDPGTTVIAVDGFIGSVTDNVDVVVFWTRDKYTEYTITAHANDGSGNVNQITLGYPGTFVKIYDNDKVLIKRLGGKVNGNFAGGVSTINVTGLTGTLKTTGPNADQMVIKGEEKLHTITATTGSVTSITFTPAIQGAFASASSTNPIMFAKGIDRIFWTDGIGPIFSWDGVHTGNLASGNIWDTGNAPAPTAAKVIVWFQNRLIAAGLVAEPDAVYFSDILDPTRWDRNFNQLRVGGGESDPIVMLVPWSDLLLAVFKQNSIYVINMDPSQNPFPEDPTQLVASFAIKLVTRHVGCGAPQTIQQVGGVGGDIFFLGSDREVRSLRRTVAAENQQELGQSISLPVRDLFTRMSRNYIANSRGFFFSDRYLIAFPIDGSVDPNAVMCFDTGLNNWSGEWIGWLPYAFGVQVLGDGRQALMVGQTAGRVHQWLEGVNVDDTIPQTFQDDGVEIATGIITRAYTFGDYWAWKTAVNLELEFLDSLADLHVNVIKDQVAQGNLGTFHTITFVPLLLPFVIPAVLPVAVFARIQKDLHRFGQFRELSLQMFTLKGKLTCRSIKLAGWMDSLQLQTLSDTPLLTA